MTDLLTALDAITKPVVTSFPQKDDDGKWIKAHTVTMAPLLQQLAEAVTGSLVGIGGSGSLASERNMLDSEALRQAGIIRSAIRDWCYAAGVSTTRDMVVDLRRWYVAYLTSDNRADEFYTSQMRKWKRTIERKLDPPKQIDLLFPCPVCGSTTGVDSEKNPVSPALIVEYPRDNPLDAVAMCRGEGCTATWEGKTAIEELMEEENERDTPETVMQS